MYCNQGDPRYSQRGTQSEVEPTRSQTSRRYTVSDRGNTGGEVEPIRSQTSRRYTVSDRGDTGGEVEPIRSQTSRRYIVSDQGDRLSQYAVRDQGDTRSKRAEVEVASHQSERLLAARPGERLVRSRRVFSVQSAVEAIHEAIISYGQRLRACAYYIMPRVRSRSS